MAFAIFSSVVDGVLATLAGLVAAYRTIISWIIDVVPSAVLAIGRSLPPSLIAVYQSTRTISGVIIEASQDHLEMLSELVSGKDPPNLFVFGSPLLSSRHSLADASNHIPRSFRACFEADLDVQDSAAPYHFIRPPDWRNSFIDFIAAAFNRCRLGRKVSLPTLLDPLQTIENLVGLSLVPCCPSPYLWVLLQHLIACLQLCLFYLQVPYQHLQFPPFFLNV